MNTGYFLTHDQSCVVKDILIVDDIPAFTNSLIHTVGFCLRVEEKTYLTWLNASSSETGSTQYTSFAGEGCKKAALFLSFAFVYIYNFFLNELFQGLFVFFLI